MVCLIIKIRTSFTLVFQNKYWLKARTLDKPGLSLKYISDKC